MIPTENHLDVATEQDSLLGGVEPLSGWWWLPPNWTDGILLTGSLLYGMNAGIFFIFSVCIMPSLASVTDSKGIEIMQKINDVIQNPLFFLVFMGGLVQGIALITVLQYRGEKARKFVYWKYGLASSICYIFGCFLVTVFANVPRNDALAAMDAGDDAASKYWRDEYLTKWVAWNHVRTAFCIVACILSTIAFRLNTATPVVPNF